jgi:hypothetical protein
MEVFVERKEIAKGGIMELMEKFNIKGCWG